MADRIKIDSKDLEGNPKTVYVNMPSTKENREAMSLYGSQNGGPDFNESTPHQSLTIDELTYWNFL